MIHAIDNQQEDEVPVVPEPMWPGQGRTQSPTIYILSSLTPQRPKARAKVELREDVNVSVLTVDSEVAPPRDRFGLFSLKNNIDVETESLPSEKTH